MDKNEGDSRPQYPKTSCDMDRNPSPPTSDDEEGATEDSIGSTVYSKHWFFTTLTRLIEFASLKEKSQAKEEDEEEDGGDDDEDEIELDEDIENDICKVWDMSMNEEVALFLKEFNAPDIFIGVMAKSNCNRLTEICVGILGNMACFQETCTFITNNDALGELLLLLMCHTDPPILLETTRLLLSCLSQEDVMGTWLERIRKCPTVRENLCFIMSSSTNGDLLVKVGELVDKMFDVDEDLMLDWIKAGGPQPQAPATDTDEEKPVVLGLVPSLLEAAKQLKYESPDGLDAYMHILQLVTTVDEGIFSIVQDPGDGKQTWDFLFDLVSQDLCQPGDPSLIVQEQRSILCSVLAVMSVLFTSETEQEYMEIGRNLSLLGSLTRMLENMETCQQNGDVHLSDGEDLPHNNAPKEDFHLKILREVCCEFLSNILPQLTKENILDALKEGHITKDKILCGLQNLLPLYDEAVEGFLKVLGEADPALSETLKKEISAREFMRSGAHHTGHH
ncbi:protein SAAL1 [Leptodactylus fuscus]|uniref:protein SAAL1 n=1 Tax=Leptodactylus fuscus TaxID=238119 RepID=UPI003F4F3AAA